MICDPVKRQMLTEFKILGFCFSTQVQRVVNDNEDELYIVLSKIEFDGNGHAEASLNNLKLIITAFEIIEENQSESTVIVHVVSIDEDLEERLQKEDIKEFLNGVSIE